MSGRGAAISEHRLRALMKGGVLSRAHWKLAVVLLFALATFAVTGAAGGAPQRTAAGTVVFGAEQEPPCLNGFLEGCNNTWTAWTAGIALASPYLVYPDFTARPYLGRGKLVK